MRPARRRTLRRQQRSRAGLPHSPPHRARDSRGRQRCYTRVQENERAASCRRRFRRRNRGEHAILLHRSERFGSGVPSTSTGRSQLWRLHFVNRGVQGGTDVGRSPESGPVSRSVPVLVLCCRPGRSPGPGRLTPKMGAGNHPGQDAKPTTHRLTLLCVVRWRSPLRRRPAIGRWSPGQLVHLSAVCRDSSDLGSRRRVCTIATRNKTSHRSAQGCGVL